jgi:hypothetical protein
VRRFDQDSATCRVYTFKEGLLSPVAHDLRLRVTRFAIEVGEQIEARFDASSLIVETPMKDGREHASALSEADKLKIADQIRDDVLHSDRYREITFRSSSWAERADGGFDLSGALTLHGVTRSIVARTVASEGRQRLELALHQPDFGITPFRALMGTLKIRADVRVEIEASTQSAAR